MLHVKSAQCVAHEFHTIALGPLERMCWRRFAAQRHFTVQTFECMQWNACVHRLELGLYSCLKEFYNNNNNNNDCISIALFHVKHAQLRCTVPMNNTHTHTHTHTHTEFWGNRVRNHVNSKGKKPSTIDSDAASHRTANPTHCWQHYSSPVDASYSCRSYRGKRTSWQGAK